jgi:hypothetical protein
LQLLRQPVFIFVVVMSLYTVARSVRNARSEARAVHAFDDVVAHFAFPLLLASFWPNLPRAAGYAVMGLSFLIWVIAQNRSTRRDPRIAALTRRETDDKQS